MCSILNILKIIPSSQSIDYVENKKQFQLHTLLTEQRHKNTWNLSFTIKENPVEGLKMIFSVDDDITKKFHKLVENTEVLEQAVTAVFTAIKNNKKIYVYGCGATGRLSKQMESAIWKPFWKKIKKHKLWKKIKKFVPKNIEENLIGEMTGGDRALISALEGFEDLQLVGKMQLLDHGIKKGDVVFCITEGGETSSVIGTILTALSQYNTDTETHCNESRKNLYFIYNNPDNVLKPFHRSKGVIDNPGITKINLATGPQAITGSTRMQAATSETFLMGVILEEAIYRILNEGLTKKELTQLGFIKNVGIKNRLLSFDSIRKSIDTVIKDIAKFTVLETETYKNKHFTTYFAKKALIAVFIDCAERSPTFRLFPLDTVNEKERKCWIQVWTEAKNCQQAWKTFLGRKFYGLKEEFYKPHFETEIDDQYLKHAAINSLSRAGDEQQHNYDFSFSKQNIKTRGPKKNDLGVIVCVDEEINDLKNLKSSGYKFIKLFKQNNANVCIIMVSDKKVKEITQIKNKIPMLEKNDVVINIPLKKFDDPLDLRKQVLLKILLNGHSTGVMSRIGRVVGNTMTYVNPSNLKLIGRATFLIMSHVNDTISQPEWIKKYGETTPLSYSEINAVLFDAMDYVSKHPMQVAEVAMSIVRILEAIKRQRYVSWEEVLNIIDTQGLENYLSENNPSLRYKK